MGTSQLLRRYGDEVPSFATMWQDHVDTITAMTSHGLNAEDPLSSTQSYAGLFLHANALVCSRFLETLVGVGSPLNMVRKERIEKLKRRLGKVCQYVSGISNLIQRAKRILPIAYRWVTDTFPGTGEGVFGLCDSPYSAVARGLNTPSLSQNAVDKLHERFPSIFSNWERRQTVHALVHAELRIILHLGPPPPHGSPASLVRPHPIGVSKRSCLCCVLWIGSHNRIFGTQWMTSGSHGKPYANWALPGAVYGYAVEENGMSSVDAAVLNAVSVSLEDTLDWLLPGQRRISDEDESFNDEQGEPEWVQEVYEIAI